MPKHFQPSDDKHYLIDDLNDFLTEADATPIEYETRMTIAEINNLYHAFYELKKRWQKAA